MLIQVCGNNPAAIDPTTEQWKKIAEVSKAKGLIILFDCTYVGFASGSMEEDMRCLRIFREAQV